uniref:Peptidase S1 domain-containing protein n=1 Tax=Leptobrachium leishanense TaxID=445787 RepID=A0A8C5PZB0_9ANUR
MKVPGLWLASLLLTGFMAAAAASGCGQKIFNTRIVGGSGAAQGAWPWQVSIVYEDSHICGGALVSRSWVVSAAHCCRYREVDKFQILLGYQNLTNADAHTVLVYVKSITIHPSYDLITNYGDLAVMELKSPVSFTNHIQPICIPHNNDAFPEGKMCWVTGWGNIKSGAHLPQPLILQEVELPLINSSTCDHIYHETFNLHPLSTIVYEEMLCAGYLEGEKDACQGDSGGPLSCKVGNVWFLTGVVSWGQDCAKPGQPGVYTKVSSFHAWIQEKVYDLNDTSTDTSTITITSTSTSTATTSTSTATTRKTTSAQTTLNQTSTKQDALNPTPSGSSHCKVSLSRGQCVHLSASLFLVVGGFLSFLQIQNIL